jgi:Protein of unknown function (DUF3800)
MVPLSASVYYVFLDESGDFNFSATGTKYFTVTALSAAPPFPWESPLIDLHYSLIGQGLDIEYFHATEDRQAVRDQVFPLISQHLPDFRLDAVVVEKPKTVPHLQTMEAFYGKMLGYLIRHVVGGLVSPGSTVVIVTDRIPTHGKRKAVEKAVKTTLSLMLPPNVTYYIFHHDSKSCVSLQAVDYCNWAIYRKWRDGDMRSYTHIGPAIRSEFDIFASGEWHYYR